MRRAAMFRFLCLTVIGGPALVAAAAGNPLRHPALDEVIVLTKGGVDYDVVVERVRRLRSLPTLDPITIARLANEGVPERVLSELTRRKEVVGDCETPEPKPHRTTLEHPAIQAVIRMANGGVTTDLMVERIAAMPIVPALNARTIVKLTSKAVPDRALLELVRKQAIPPRCEPVPAPGAPTKAAPPVEDARSHPPAVPAAESPSPGRIRVVVESSVPVTYLEILVDGASVTRKGEIYRGETQPGWTLPLPLILELKRGVTTYESDLPSGRHEIRTDFALSWIVDTDWDARREVRGQRYETLLVGTAGEDREPPVCQLLGGQTCVVRVRLSRRGDRYVVGHEIRLR